MSFKLYNSTINQQQNINNLSVDLSNTSPPSPPSPSSTLPLRDIIVLDNVGGSSIYTYNNGSVIYSLNQNPGQLVVDTDIGSPPVGTEYIIVTDNNNTIYLQSQSTTVALQISGKALNRNVNQNIIMGLNSSCTLTKISATLWMVKGDSLDYET
jgi:hypothetical protein